MRQSMQAGPAGTSSAHMIHVNLIKKEAAEEGAHDGRAHWSEHFAMPGRHCLDPRLGWTKSEFERELQLSLRAVGWALCQKDAGLDSCSSEHSVPAEPVLARADTQAVNERERSVELRRRCCQPASRQELELSCRYSAGLEGAHCLSADCTTCQMR